MNEVESSPSSLCSSWGEEYGFVEMWREGQDAAEKLQEDRRRRWCLPTTITAEVSSSGEPVQSILFTATATEVDKRSTRTFWFLCGHSANSSHHQNKDITCQRGTCNKLFSCVCEPREQLNLQTRSWLIVYQRISHVESIQKRKPVKTQTKTLIELWDVQFV